MCACTARDKVIGSGVDIYMFVYKIKSEQYLRDLLLGRELILHIACHSTSCTAQWHLLHMVIPLKHTAKKTTCIICLLRSDQHISYTPLLTS